LTQQIALAIADGIGCDAAFWPRSPLAGGFGTAIKQQACGIRQQSAFATQHSG